MAKCIAHEPCPKCGSRDNLGRYDDGSAFCFGCRYYEPPIRQRRMPLEPTKTLTEPPNDLSSYLPSLNREWLLKYGLNEDEIKLFKYSPSIDRHLYLVYDHKKLVYWEARGINKHPKTLSHGPKPLHILGHVPKSKTVVLVEDVVSAIKVSRYLPCMPLFGSVLQSHHLIPLAEMFERVIFWLDHDKWKESLEQARTFLYLDREVSNIRTVRDPKELPEEEIKKLLDRHTKA